VGDVAGQSIRPSQFITTYGPGSILEAPDGPRIILSMERSGLFDGGRRASDFDITSERLSKVLNGGRVARLPTNAELNVPDSQPLYRTASFPGWSLCMQHGVLYRCRWVMTRGCVHCGAGAKEAIWAKARREAIRFVRACPAGHLDDVDWAGIVNHQRDGCQPRHLLWEGSGSLRNIEIRCPGCRGSINLGLAYGRQWPCSGRYSERDGGGRSGERCDRLSHIIQRGAANLRVTELVSTINILPQDTPLHRILSRPATQGALVSPPASKEELLGRLQKLAGRHLIPPSDVFEIERYSDAQVMEAVRDVSSGWVADSVKPMLHQELRELQRAAAHGAPPVQARTPGMPPIFEVIQGDVRCLPGPCGRLLRITPVSRLQVTVVQVGYRRLIGDDPDRCELVPVSFTDSAGTTWYPGIELSGEGIFVDLAPAPDGSASLHFPLHHEEAQAWLEAWAKPAGYGRRQAERDRLHPVFVWWHTLAHRLITALAVDSGYSSTAVRERIYTEIDPTGPGRGGVLLYTVQPGGDGTLGGLISLVNGFERVLDRVFRDLDACSNDPLCGGERFAPGRLNGAACYACLLVSETSCEFRNTSLDRNLLRHNLP
jgi:hypothetical protein